MPIDRSDCISITEKTFDLTLDDCVPGMEESNKIVSTENLLEESQLNDDDEEQSATIVGSGSLPDHQQPIKYDHRGKYHLYSGSFHSNGLLPNRKYRGNDTDQIVRNDDNNHHAKIDNEVVESLRNCIAILSRVCGNDKVEVNTNGDFEMKRISEILRKLSENCELRLMFYEKNYKFLEGLYDTLTKDHESLKKKLRMKDDEIKELQLKYKEIERLSIERSVRSEFKQEIPEVTISSKTGSDSHIDASDGDSLKAVIEKQQREIKEYKRFIKELMERE